MARRHAELLLEVEGVQAEQMSILRCLIRHHGLRCVYCEGLTPTEMANYREQIAVPRAMENDQIPALKKQLVEVQGLLAEMTVKGQPDMDRHRKAAGIEKQTLDMLDDHKARLLERGAAGRLLISGELEEVLSLDDESALEASRPITPDGRVKIDKDRVRAREEAQVRLLLAGEPVAVIVLGGDLDLGKPLRAATRDRVEYFRITTSMFRQFSAP